VFGRRQRAAAAAALVCAFAAAAMPVTPASGENVAPAAPAHVVELPGDGTVTVAWSAGTGSVSSYEIAPLVDGSPCGRCSGANAVAASTTSVVLGAGSGMVTRYAVQSRSPAGASPWVVAQLPDLTPGGPAPRVTSGHDGTRGAPWVATLVPGNPTSMLDTAPSGYTRTVARDEGFSVPTADDGDLWLFGDTTVQDTPQPGTFGGQASCFTRDGTAAVGTETTPPLLHEALQTATSAMVAQTASCTGDLVDLPVNTSEPYQVLGAYSGALPGITCSNWVNGATDQLSPTGALTDNVLAAYASNCFTASNLFTGVTGAWTTRYQTTSATAQHVTMPLGSRAMPDLPAVSCPANAFTSYAGGLLSSVTGVYGSALDFGGYDYFYAPYGDSTYAFAGFAIPEATCSAMAIARVPDGNSSGGTAYADDPLQYQYLEPNGQWQSPAQTGKSAQALASSSADILPSDYGGAYAGQVDVTRLANGEFAMLYMLPAPLGDANGGTDVAAIRTASTPWGPWSTPQPFEIPSFEWGTYYQVVIHPELSTPDALALSYVTVANDGALVDRQVAFATLPAAGLPAPGAVASTGYDLAASDGGIFSFGGAGFYGSMGGHRLNQPIVGLAATADGRGYWEVARDGGIFAFGDARFYGSMGGHRLNQPIVGLAATADGRGYWEVARDGGIFAFGDALFMGSMGGKFLFSPIVGMAAPRGGGYLEVASDGGVFSFGATFMGSIFGKNPGTPIVGLTPTADGSGYWEVAKYGRVFAFGGARFAGPAGIPPSLFTPVVALAGDPAGGYWQATSTGGVFAFGTPFKGSAGTLLLRAPIVAIAAVTSG
jgi:hypothetical protein